VVAFPELSGQWNASAALRPNSIADHMISAQAMAIATMPLTPGALSKGYRIFSLPEVMPIVSQSKRTHHVYNATYRKIVVNLASEERARLPAIAGVNGTD
jgi:hypothetical protein